MKMMTGAILILAGSLLLCTYQITEPRVNWLEWYSFGLTFLGIAFLGWGFMRDVSISYRRKQRASDDK